MQVAETSNSPGTKPGIQQPKLLDRMRDALRVRHYALATERTYIQWARRYILFHGKKHPADMGAEEVEAYITHLAVVGRVSATTQNQALAALLFLYRIVLGQDLPWLANLTRARQTVRLPVVLSQAETARLLRNVQGVEGLVIRLLYGAGLRLMECLRLRVLDVDLDLSLIHI